MRTLRWSRFCSAATMRLPSRAASDSTARTSAPRRAASSVKVTVGPIRPWKYP